MDGEHIPAVILLIIFMLLACNGVVHLVVDSRSFEKIKEECTKTGKIQNKDTRIFCQVEPEQK